MKVRKVVRKSVPNRDIRRMGKEKLDSQRNELARAMLTILVERAGGHVEIEGIDQYVGRAISLDIIPAPAQNKVIIRTSENKIQVTVDEHDRA